MKIYSEMQSRAMQCCQRRVCCAVCRWCVICYISKLKCDMKLQRAHTHSHTHARLELCIDAAKMSNAILFLQLLSIFSPIVLWRNARAMPMGCIQKISHYCICLTSKIRTKDENEKRTNE